ncbi:hypothetical protein PR048_004308 [Dryococelus australis]|uniref:Uncharacterized protein n=1 Tax=Dryococelus australis TaxID=614101 RepID=A0ABQ9I546_9NEOP|nr:hypothetical protein PR048_004308 [Dryococelus australis]
MASGNEIMPKTLANCFWHAYFAVVNKDDVASLPISRTAMSSFPSLVHPPSLNQAPAQNSNMPKYHHMIKQ